MFNDSPLVSAKTKRKVLKAAEELNYRHNRLAAALRSGKSKTIGIVVPEINNYFFGNVINSIEKNLANSGYSSIITQSYESFETERAALDSLLKLNVDGILISNSKNTQDYSFFEKTQKEGTPIVFFDRMPDFENSNAVLLDDFKGGVIATSHLIDSGCSNLVHVVGDAKVSIFNQRKEGFLHAVQENKKVVENHYLIELSFEVEKDRKVLNDLLTKNPNIDGFFCHGDKFSVHVMNMLRLLGYAIPEQVKLIGFGNNDYTEFTYPKMSSIDQKCDQMGALAVEMLLDTIDKETIIYSKQVLSPNLIIRGSSRQID